jgi:hypothetical protein
MSELDFNKLDAEDVTCSSGNGYKVFISLDELMMYNIKTKELDMCCETETPDSIECVMSYFKIDEVAAKSYLGWS